MSDIIVTITDDDETVVSVQESTTNTASSDLYNPLPRIEDIGNVDASTLVNGSVLVYKTITNRWTSTTKLDAQDVDAGEF